MLPTQRKSTLQNRIDTFLKHLFKNVLNPPYNDDLAHLYKASIVIVLTFVASVIAAVHLDPVFFLVPCLIVSVFANCIIHGSNQDDRKWTDAAVIALVVTIAAFGVGGVLWSPILLVFAGTMAFVSLAAWTRKPR